MSNVRRRAAAAAVAVATLASLSGCWAGFDAGTSVQANQAVGNGANLTAGDVDVRGATWVRNVENPTEATLVATFVTGSDVPDKLVKVEIDPASPMGITGGELEIPAQGSVRTGHWSPSFINAFDFKVLPSAFVPTTFTFRNAGTVTGDVLVVANTGQYAGVPVSLDRQQELQAPATGEDAAEQDGAKKGKKAEQVEDAPNDEE